MAFAFVQCDYVMILSKVDEAVVVMLNEVRAEGEHWQW